MFAAAASRCLCNPHLPVNAEPAGSCRQNECVFSRSLESVLLSFLPLLSVMMSDFSTAPIWCYFSPIFGLSSCLGLETAYSKFTAGATPKSFFFHYEVFGFYVFFRKYEKSFTERGIL